LTTSRARASAWWPTLSVGPARSARARHAHNPPRPTAGLRIRQRHRAYQHGDPALVAGERHRLALHRAGKPTQNAFIESFNGRLRDGLLKETLFGSLARSAAIATIAVG
jgi:hypothetical protein